MMCDGTLFDIAGESVLWIDKGLCSIKLFSWRKSDLLLKCDSVM